MRDIDFIKNWEGCKLKAYLDSVGILTIGYGHTGSDVTKGLIITQQQADSLLDLDLSWARDCVKSSVNQKITEHMRAALVSLIFNIGCPAFKKSTLLKRLNEKNFSAAADQFLRWDKARGVVLKGLSNRRRAERALFLSEIETDQPALGTIIKEKTMLPSFIAAALPSLLNRVPELIRIFGNGEESEKNAQAAEKVVEIAKTVTGEATAEGAVLAIESDPAMAQAFDEQAKASFLEIEALAEKRVAAAREFNRGEEPVLGKFKFVHIISLIVVFAALLAIGYILIASVDATERAMGLQAVIGSLLAAMGYWIGSSSGSDKKTEIMKDRASP